MIGRLSMVSADLHTLGEFGLIRRIQRQAGTADHLLKGIGDDCAVQTYADGTNLLTSTDLLIEDVHFRLGWLSMEELGRKAAAVNISDIAAMGGQPKSLFLGVASSADMNVAQLEQLTKGFIFEAGRYGAVLAGGDTCRSPGPLMISVTVQGEVESGRAVCRAGAREGDLLYVSGTLGDSALALSELMAARQPDRFLLERHNTPTARVSLGREIASRGAATAMLDISDGLLADLGHILEECGLGADIELEKLPLSPAFQQSLKQDPALIDLALAGGEDYELLLTSSDQMLASAVSAEPGLTGIGTISRQPGIRLHRLDGTLYQCSRGGFDHFS